MQNSLLPPITNEQELDRLFRQDELWLPAIQSICRRHGLPTDSLRRFPDGSSVVWGAGGKHIVKLMPPFWQADAAREIQVLRHMQDAGLATPRVWFAGEVEGWPYFVMDCLPGLPGQQIWPDLPRDEQQRVAAQLGELLAQLHQIPVDGLEGMAVDWPAFFRQQQAGFVRQQERYGVSPAWIGLLDAFLAQQAPGPARPALMHCEVMTGHLMLAERNGHWQISGFFDFGDPMVGHFEYEFGSVCVFLTPQRPDLLRALLLAYGYAPGDLNAELSERLMAMTLLHRFASVPYALRHIGVDAQPSLALFRETFFLCA